ncbi:E3 ubiquitin-protein ligase Topors-like [Acyrthosiphon pisum]|uniref:RING-type E3 ubiquitin transferase n=1 Tax=Acyrthosiphon pisum TaxID=7029 RepID=A0A8R1VZC3_ACYPI|nr:E3 ubiquitin-protein ligase Topors-like [Acyrthosiphon pisum]|eukprot:XP_001943770.2 PREDICTED: E3 ubiquitin-protein ligase Topors-like [Acyrthosiphon pisum]
MSINRKSKPNDVVESSSDDEETISTINTRPTESSSTPDSQCSICLDELTNPCNTNSCLHLFCFECLLLWSNSAQICPLCRKTFNYIYHSFDDLGAHETYDVSIHVPRLWDSPELSMDPTRFLLESMTGQDGILNADIIGQILSYHNISDTPLIGTEMRTYVYTNNAWADPLPDSTGRTLDSSPAYYRADPMQTSRLYIFILRDIIAVRESLRVGGQTMPLPNLTDVFMTNYIMQLLFTHEISQLHYLDVLRSILDLHAVQFFHELYNFASSPYDIREYDLNVTFTFRLYYRELTEPLPSETSVLNSDNEEVQTPMIITNVSSSTNDSDVIQSHSFRSIEPLISASIDQPSTSTGIQDCLNRPNNSFQSVDGGSFPYSSHLKRRSSNQDSSSDNDDSIISTRGSKTAHIKSRDIKKEKKKKRKLKKKINTNDSGSEIPSTNRNRSYSESSSTSGETDTN